LARAGPCFTLRFVPELFLPLRPVSKAARRIAAAESQSRQATTYRTVFHVNYTHVALLAVVLVILIGGVVLYLRPRLTGRS
jgi:hypothetical protein